MNISLIEQIEKVERLLAALKAVEEAKTQPVEEQDLRVKLSVNGMDFLSMETGHGLTRDRAQEVADSVEVSNTIDYKAIEKLLLFFRDKVTHGAVLSFALDNDGNVVTSCELIENVAEFCERIAAQDD